MIETQDEFSKLHAERIALTTIMKNVGADVFGRQLLDRRQMLKRWLNESYDRLGVVPTCICRPAGFGSGEWCPKCQVFDNH